MRGFEIPVTRPRRRLSLGVLIVASLSAGWAQAGPAELAAQLQGALQAGDPDAALKLASLDGAPAELRFMFLDTVADCAQDVTCQVSAVPLPADYQEKTAERCAEQGTEFAVPAEGLLAIEGKTADGKGAVNVKVPYAQVNGEYKLISMRYTAAKLAELRATSNEQLLDEMIQSTMRHDDSPTPVDQWKAAATKLPEDGGEAGAWLVRQTEALAAAAKANDPDAAAATGGTWASTVFGATSWDGSPVPERVRKLKLRSQAVRFLVEIRVLGGYQHDADTLLLYEGRDGAGWIERGVALLDKRSGEWERRGDQTVSYPQ